MIEPIPEKSRTVAGIKEGMKSGYYVTPENNEPFYAMEHLITVVDLQAAEIIAWREMASYYLDSESTTHQCDLMAKKLLGRATADYAGKTVVDSAELIRLQVHAKGLHRCLGEHADANDQMSAALFAQKRKIEKLRNALEVIRSELGKIHVEEPISRAYSTAHTALTDLYVNAAKMTEPTRAADPADTPELNKLKQDNAEIRAMLEIAGDNSLKACITINRLRVELENSKRENACMEHRLELIMKEALCFPNNPSSGRIHAITIGAKDSPEASP